MGQVCRACTDCQLLACTDPHLWCLTTSMHARSIPTEFKSTLGWTEMFNHVTFVVQGHKHVNGICYACTSAVASVQQNDSVSQTYADSTTLKDYKLNT